MKMHKGWVARATDGTSWYNTCDRWAKMLRNEGYRVERCLIVGNRKTCSC